VHGPPLTTNHGNEEDHLVSETLTEDSEAGALLLLHGKMLFLTHSAKGNPLGGLYIPDYNVKFDRYTNFNDTKFYSPLNVTLEISSLNLTAT
jgi:hypothetical protein